MIIDRIALILAVIGGLNWGLVGLFRFDLVAYLFGGQTATVSRIVYTLVGIAAVWCISLIFRERDAADEASRLSNETHFVELSFEKAAARRADPIRKSRLSSEGRLLR